MTESKVLVFSVDGHEFGAYIREVREVIAAPEITPLPKARDPVVGIFNLRGNIVTAVDGGRALGVEAHAQADQRSRAVVADLEGHLVGLIVDRATEVLSVNPEEVKPAPRVGPLAREELAEGVLLHDARAIVILSLRDLLRLEGAPGGAASAEGRNES